MDTHARADLLDDLAGLRRHLGLTQADLAADLGLHPNHWAQVERGERPLGRQARAALLYIVGVRRPKRRT